ncbi:MAG: hypothetical protein A2X64_02610 [Ignavibacteria bacterium GWF2_33_9]|nr:MAG: hypothetical protein A2X64_02610 [Ignavibacteria bacterium GWF2_33_9]
MLEISDISFHNALNLVIKFRKQVIRITIVVFLVGIIYAVITPHQYVASGSIMPPKQNNNNMNLSAMMQALGGSMGGLSSLAGDMGQSNLSLVYSEVLKSNSVINYVIDTLNLYNSEFYKKLPRHKLIKELRDNIDILVDKSGIIYVSTTVNTNLLPDKSQRKRAAKLAAAISNAEIAGLDFVIRNRNNSVSAKTKDFIGTEIDNYQRLLDSIQTTLQDFRQNNKILELEEQTKAIVLQANTIATELAKAEVELSIGKSLYSENSQNYRMLKNSYDMLKSQYNKIQSGGITQNDKFSIPLNEFPSLIKEYTNLMRDQKLYEEILIYLRTNYYQEAIQEKRDIPQVDILDWAMIPAEKNAPIYKILLIVFAMLDIAIIFVFLLYKSSKIKLNSASQE